MKKIKTVIFLLLLVVIIVVGYRLVKILMDQGYVNFSGGETSVTSAETREEKSKSEAPTDNIMKYVDTQGTDVVYSSLTLEPVDANTSYGEIVLHRITTLTGMATFKGNEEYEFSDTDIGISGTIRIEGSSASFTVTNTAVSFVQVGDQFVFTKAFQ